MCDNNNQNATDIILNDSDVRQVFVNKKKKFMGTHSYHNAWGKMYLGDDLKKPTKNKGRGCCLTYLDLAMALLSSLCR